MTRNEELIARLEMIKADIKTAVAEFDGKPFTVGESLGYHLGYQRAAIAALASTIIKMLETEEKESCQKTDTEAETIRQNMT